MARIFTKGTPFIIVSTTREGNSHDENLDNFEQAVAHLKAFNVPFHTGIGSWRGQAESVVVLKDSDDGRCSAHLIAAFCRQQCILYVDGQDNASFGDVKHGYLPSERVIGRFTNTPEWEAERASEYTAVGRHYYVVKT